MEFLIYFLAVFLVIFTYYVYSIQFSTRKLPPGPFNSPFGLGVVPSLMFSNPKFLLNPFSVSHWEMLHKMQKQFGDYFSVEAGSFSVVVISSYDILQEIANLDEYSIKFAHEAITHPRTFHKELGLIFVANPEIWVEMRKFTQRVLRKYGFGKRHTMQSAIEAETAALVEVFKDAIRTEGGIIRIRTTFVLAVLNVLWCMVAGQRYKHDDPKLKTLMERNFAMTKSTTFAEPFQFVFMYLKKIFPSFLGEDLRLKAYRECHEFTKTLVEERTAMGSYKSEPENYIDVFMQKIEQSKENEPAIYTDEQLQAMLADLLQTGTTTTNGTLSYGLLYLLLNPETQRKCQAEIDAIVPRHLTPTIEDVEKMPYFQAFILETHRLANIVPLPIPRLVPEDWNFKGYWIPKGTVILSNHYSVHMDEKYWGDPQMFRPERFINDKGEFVPDKRVVHFGFGKRICIGITLANSVIPIFLATLLQHFNFSVVPGTKPPSTDPELGVSLSPKEYSVHVTERELPEQLKDL